MRPKIAHHTVVVLAVASFAATLVACSSSSTSTKFPAQVRESFVLSCASQPGADETLCDRCLELIEEQYELDEFVQLDTAIRSGVASRADSEKLARIMIECSGA